MYSLHYGGSVWYTISDGCTGAGASVRVTSGKLGCEHERWSSACVPAQSERKGRIAMKNIIMSSVVPGAAVAGFGFAAAAYGGPVVWAAFWGAVVFVLSRA